MQPGSCAWRIRGPALLLCLAAVGCGDAPEFEPVSFSKAAPVQERLQEGAPEIRLNEEVWLRPRATYSLDAYVMSRKSYAGAFLGDGLSDLVPVDFALAWGPAAQPTVQALLTIRQAGRWYYWRGPAGVELPLSPGELNANMANVHIIPADSLVLAETEGVEAGRCYRLSGQLVDIDATDPQLARRTSMSRADSGAGACEILYLEHLAEIACPAPE